MTEEESPDRVSEAARAAGRQVAAAGRAYRRGRAEGHSALEADEDGRVRIVCRRYAERRAVTLDAAGRPACYDPESTDCRGCVEDVRAGRVETWE